MRDDDLPGGMPLDEYERDINRRLWRRRLRAASVVVFNPVTALFGAIAVLEVAFKLLGWSE